MRNVRPMDPRLVGLEGFWPTSSPVVTTLSSANVTNQQYVAFAFQLTLAMVVDEVGMIPLNASADNVSGSVSVVAPNSGGDDTFTTLPQGGFLTKKQNTLPKTPVQRMLLGDPSNGSDGFLTKLPQGVNREDTAVPFISREKIPAQAGIMFLMKNLQAATNEVMFYFKAYPLQPKGEEAPYAAGGG